MADKKNEVAKVTKPITDQVLAKIQEFEKTGALCIPKDYVPANALKGAFLVLTDTKDKDGNSVLKTCTQNSIANSLFKMVVDGLSVLKTQCYFIAFGKELTYIKSYFGNIAIAKRYSGVKNVIAQAVYADDEFKFDVNTMTGDKRILEHKQTLESMSSQVTGGYCIVTRADGSLFTEVMNFDQITKAWNQRRGSGLTPAHNIFPDEMAKRTVINRATKGFINTANDAIFTDEKELKDKNFEDTKHEIKENANKESFNIEDAEIIGEEKKEMLSSEQPSRVKEDGKLFPEQQNENEAENEIRNDIKLDNGEPF